MNRTNLTAFALASLVATAASAEQRGAPLTSSFTMRGPLQQTVVGASVVSPSGAVASAARAHIDVPPGSIAQHAQLVWLGSAFDADTNVGVVLPDGRAFDVTADACVTLDAGASSPMPYFRCTTDLTLLFRNGGSAALVGEIEVSGIDVDTGAPWSIAQGFAGAFALVVVYADPNDTTPRVIEIADGLMWSKNGRVIMPALPAFEANESAGRLSVVAIEGDAEIPGDGECGGDLDDATCDFVGMCTGTDCDDVLFAATNDANPLGNVFNESAGDALDIDNFDLAGLLPGGQNDDLHAFIQTGGDAVLQALVVLGVPDADSDADGLSDNAELEYGTQLNEPDTDGDGILDGVEVYGRTPADPRSTPTDPLNADSDNDGLDDGVEDANHNGVRDDGETYANNADTDDDGLTDGAERLASYPGVSCTDGHADPLNPDSDSDGATDGAEDADHDSVIAPSETSPCSFDAPPPLLVDMPLPPDVVSVNPTVPDSPVLGIIPGDNHGTAPDGEGSLVANAAERANAHLLNPTAIEAPTNDMSGSTIWGCSSGTSANAVVWMVLAFFAFQTRRYTRAA